MIIYLRRKKMLFIFAKNGLYYQFLSNTTSEQNEAKFPHEYGLGLDDLYLKECMDMVCPMHIPMPNVYELLEKRYKRIVSMYDFAPNSGGLLQPHQSN